MKILITENQLRKVQFKFLNYLFEDMYEVESKIRSWEKDGEIILELGDSGHLWVLESIWNHISNTLSLDYDETKKLIKDWAEQHLELEGITPESVFGFFWGNN